MPLPSGRQTVLRFDDQEAVVVEVGGGLRTYRAGGIEVLDGYGEDQRCSSGRGQALLPWPNRLDGGRFDFDGVAEQAPLTEVEAGNAIHGLTRWATWSVLDAGTSWATLGHRLHPQPGWAWTLDLTLDYRLGPSGLSVTVSARNRDRRPSPIGAGFHPYLVAPTGRVDDLTVTFAAATRYLADQRGIPTGTEPTAGTDFDFGPGRRLGDRVIDVAFADLARDHAGDATVMVADDASGRATTVRLGTGWSHVMVFTGDTVGGGRARQGLAVEPMSGPANLLASGDGRVVLEPGATWSATFAIEPGWL